MGRRLFVIEPGLDGRGGHPLQYATALNAYCRDNGTPVVVVCRDGVESEAVRDLEIVEPILRAHCFPVETESAASFCSSLLTLDERYRLNRDDLLLISSGHVNECEGLYRFMGTRRAIEVRPQTAINIHQVVPPLEDGAGSISSEVESHWLARLGDVLHPLVQENPNVSLWTTDSITLNQQIRTASGIGVGILPFVFVRGHERLDNGQRYCCGFVGDGRAEKGQLIMLKAIVDWFAGRQDVDFVVQILRPRGYTHGEETSFELLVATARKLKNVTFVDGSLSPHEFDELLDQIDCMICPYDPRHYHNRASLVFTQAAAVGIPCIVSRATSMMQQIHRGLAAGIDFVIDEDDCDGNAKRLAIAIDSVHEEQLLLKERAKLLVPKVIDYHCAKRYVELIMQRHPPL